MFARLDAEGSVAPNMLGNLSSSTFAAVCSGKALQFSVRFSPGCNRRGLLTTNGVFASAYSPFHSIVAGPPTYSVSCPGKVSAGPSGSTKPNQSLPLFGLVPGSVPGNPQPPAVFTGW